MNSNPALPFQRWIALPLLAKSHQTKIPVGRSLGRQKSDPPKLFMR